MKCPLKKAGGGKGKTKSHGNRVKIGLATKQTEHGDAMGRIQLTLDRHCRGSHFTWDERLRLQCYHAGSNGYRKERSPTVLGKIFQKSPRTIARELDVFGQVEFLTFIMRNSPVVSSGPNNVKA